jgi:hypothetical protein
LASLEVDWAIPLVLDELDEPVFEPVDEGAIDAVDNVVEPELEELVEDAPLEVVELPALVEVSTKIPPEEVAVEVEDWVLLADPEEEPPELTAAPLQVIDCHDPELSP